MALLAKSLEEVRSMSTGGRTAYCTFTSERNGGSSMKFDPYYVSRWEWSDEGSLDRCSVVSAEDYDRLLDLYRDAKEEADFHSDRLDSGPQMDPIDISGVQMTKKDVDSM